MPPEKHRILVVDDHAEMVNLLADQLRDDGYVVDVATDGTQALELAERILPDVVVTDLRMKGVDGLDVLSGVREIDPELPVLIMTAFGAVESAVEAIKRGAYHYFTKPFQLRELQVFVERALEERRLRAENRALRRIAEDRSSLDAIIGDSRPMQHLKELIVRAAGAEAPVLIRGESGSGKELVARALHFLSPRASRAFVAVNCTSLPEELLESELFGHARGAFTGAGANRQGLFVAADGGTLFLDEIGDMPPELQAKLLRVLEDQEIRPVGSDTTRRVDVRIVAATHQPLEDRIRDGGFRRDLYYRLDVVPLEVPPLRKRREDIARLIDYFLDEVAPAPRRFSPQLVELMSEQDWPGNVRQLQNVVRRLVILAEGEVIDVDAYHQLVGSTGTVDALDFQPDTFEMKSLRDLEEQYMRWVIERCDGNKTRAAEILGIDVSTIHRRLRN